MNIYKWYMGVVSLQTKLAMKYFEGFVAGMEKVNKDCNNEDFR